ALHRHVVGEHGGRRHRRTLALGCRGGDLMGATVTTIDRLRPRTFHPSDALILCACGLSSFSLLWVVYYRLAPFNGIQGFLILWFATFLTMYWLAVRELDGGLIAKDRAVAALVTGVSLVILVPLVSIITYTTVQGARFLTAHFFTQTLSITG